MFLQTLHENPNNCSRFFSYYMAGNVAEKQTMVNDILCYQIILNVEAVEV